jgi:hypothetical protein
VFLGIDYGPFGAGNTDTTSFLSSAYTTIDHHHHDWGL